MNANSFQDKEPETEGSEVIPSKIANKNATTPVGKSRIMICSLVI